MIRALWTSTSTVTSERPHVGPVVTAAEVEALYVAWKAAPDKSIFMSSIASEQAAALCSYIFHHEPPLPVTPRKKRVQ